MKCRLAICLFAVALTACASGGATSASHGDRNVITAAEIQQTHELNAYAVIQELRPNMLAQRGPTTFNADDPGIVVYLNGQRYGDVNMLKEITASEVVEIRYLSPGEAQYRYGTGFPQGIIEVKTAR